MSKKSRRQHHIEHEVRKRLVEYHTQQGMSEGRISLEVLYLLPPEFLDAYTELFHESLRVLESIRVGDKQSYPVKSRPGKIPLAKQAKVFNEHWQIRDYEAFERKKSIDAALRRLVPKMRSGSVEQRTVRCGECARWLQHDWKFCPWCGANEH